MPMETLQRYVERVQGNIQWVIRLLGDYLHKEGTVPPPLTPEEQARLEKDIKAFLGTIPKPEMPRYMWEDLCEQLELLHISNDEELEELDTLYDEWVVVRIDKFSRVY